MKNTFLFLMAALLLMAISLTPGAAQTTPTPSAATQVAQPGLQQSQPRAATVSDEVIIRKIADRIIASHTFGFIGATSGKNYASAKEIPAGEQVRFAGEYSGWFYANGVLNIAMLDLSDYFKDEKYANMAKQQVAQGLNNYKDFQTRLQSGTSGQNIPYRQMFAIRELDDCGAMGASVMEVMFHGNFPAYRTYIDSAARHITSLQERLADGTLARKNPNNLTVWADDLYMSVPFLARMGKLTGDRKYFDDALKQVFNFTKYLWEPKKELYYHAWFDDLKRNGLAHWGRCNGWIMIAQVQLLNYLPKDHPQRADLIKNLERQILGIAKYQDGKGVWHQLLDKNDSYPESSCSSMFVYSIARAINEGWIDRRYASIATTGWTGIKNEFITPDGELNSVCVGTGIQNDMVFYYSRPTRTNDFHGLGAVIEAGIEVHRLRASGIR